MCQKIFNNTSFFNSFYILDKNCSEEVRNSGCSCGGKLDTANYYRKPRGGPENLPSEYNLFFSFCCREDLCRKRVRPPSVRFIGRKVYLSVIVILAASIMQGLNEERVKQLASMDIKIPVETIKRWIIWWKTNFLKSNFWNSLKGRFNHHFIDLPSTLVDYFFEHNRGDENSVLLLILKMLSPINKGYRGQIV